MQNNVLVKYKIFTLFLKENYLKVYIEMYSIYSEIMSKIYYSNFKIYISEILKLVTDLYNKNDTILSPNP